MTTKLIDLPLEGVQGTYLPDWAGTLESNIKFLNSLSVKEVSLASILFLTYKSSINFYRCDLSKVETLVYVKGDNQYKISDDGDRLICAFRLVKRKLTGVLDLDVVELSIWQYKGEMSNLIHDKVLSSLILPMYKNVLIDISPYQSSTSYWNNRISFNAIQGNSTFFQLTLDESGNENQLDVVNYADITKEVVLDKDFYRDLANSKIRYLFRKKESDEVGITNPSQQDDGTDYDGSYLPSWALDDALNIAYLTELKTKGVERKGTLLMFWFGSDLEIYQSKISEVETILFLQEINHNEPPVEKIEYAVSLTGTTLDWFSTPKQVSEVKVWRNSGCQLTAKISPTIFTNFILPSHDLLISCFDQDESIDFWRRLLTKLFDLGVNVYAVGTEVVGDNHHNLLNYQQLFNSDDIVPNSKFFKVGSQNAYRLLLTIHPL